MAYPPHRSLLLRCAVHVGICAPPRSILRYCLVVTIVCGSIGCDKRGANSDNLSSSRSEPLHHDVPGKSSVLFERVLALEHDFGVVRPRSRVANSFQITNSSNEPWTLKAIHSACNCTVSSSSALVYGPQSTETVTVTYTAPASSGDDRRIITVEFEEPHVTPVQLIVHAKIRSELTCLPQDVQFGQIGEMGNKEAQVVVCNFSDSDWHSVTAKSSAKWLLCESEKVNSSLDLAAPRQSWRLLLTVIGGELAPGRHKTAVTVRANPSSELEEIVHVQVIVVPRVRSIPAELFFGNVREESIVHRSVQIYFTEGNPVPSLESIVITSEPNHILKLTISETGQRMWTLAATLDSSVVEGELSGRVYVTPANSLVPLLDIPFQARLLTD